MTKEDNINITKYDLLFESRLTRCETIAENLSHDVKEIKSDLRWMMGIWISINTIMMGLMAKGFHWY